MFRSLLLSTFLVCLAPLSFAQTLPNFKANFDVQFMGFNLGTAKQQFSCQNNLCTLTSVAKPEGLVAKFVNESTVETIKIQQSDTLFRWLSYHKTLTRHKSGRTIIKQMDLVRQNNQVIYLQADALMPRTWPASDNLYDTLSLAYAIQYRLLNHRPITGLILQDEKGQYPLQLLDRAQDSVELPWLDDEVPATYLKFKTNFATLRLWLLNPGTLKQGLNFFPAVVEVYNKRTDKTVELSLQSPPK